MQALDRFRRCIRLVRCAVRLLRLMVSISDDRTTRSAAEMQWKTLNTSDMARNLAFNPTVYARKRVGIR